MTKLGKFMLLVKFYGSVNANLWLKQHINIKN